MASNVPRRMRSARWSSPARNASIARRMAARAVVVVMCGPCLSRSVTACDGGEYGPHDSALSTTVRQEAQRAGSLTRARVVRVSARIACTRATRELPRRHASRTRAPSRERGSLEHTRALARAGRGYPEGVPPEIGGAPVYVRWRVFSNPPFDRHTLVSLSTDTPLSFFPSQ